MRQSVNILSKLVEILHAHITRVTHQQFMYRYMKPVALRKQTFEMFFKIGVLRNFAIITGKHPCWSLFF